MALVAVAVITAIALAVLLNARPHVDAAPWKRGDDLALLAAWAVAVATSAWLLVVTSACALALGCSRPQLARRIAPVLPAGIRRLVEVAIVAAFVAGPAVPAFASPAPSAVTVVGDQPVVRSVTSAPGPTAPAPVPTPTAGSVPAAPPVAVRPQPSAPARATTAPTVGNHVVVRPGDNLWLIAGAALTSATSARPSEAAVARYWHSVIAVNRSSLRSGDPSLIFPGEIITLPAA